MVYEYLYVFIDPPIRYLLVLVERVLKHLVVANVFVFVFGIKLDLAHMDIACQLPLHVGTSAIVEMYCFHLP